jgi:hypothetical protein
MSKQTAANNWMSNPVKKEDAKVPGLNAANPKIAKKGS